MLTRTAKFCGAILILAALQSCGGGGGYGSSSSTRPPPANLQSAPGLSAITAYVQATHQSNLTATDNSGNSYVIQLSQTPNAGTSAFNGTAGANSTVDSLTLTKNGVLVANAITTVYYILNPYQGLGGVSSTGTPYGVVSNFTAVPTTVTVGESGAVDTLTYYHDSTKTTLDATETNTYSAMANNSTTLLLCLESVISDVTAQGSADGLGSATESDCYTVDAAGNAALVSIALTINGTTLTFK